MFATHLLEYDVLCMGWDPKYLKPRPVICFLVSEPGADSQMHNLLISYYNA